jgi:hypothetical protein
MVGIHPTVGEEFCTLNVSNIYITYIPLYPSIISPLSLYIPLYPSISLYIPYTTFSPYIPYITN